MPSRPGWVVHVFHSSQLEGILILFHAKSTIEEDRINFACYDVIRNQFTLTFLGMFGTILLSLLLIPMYFIKVHKPFSQDPDGRLENVLDAFKQIDANLLILVALGGEISHFQAFILYLNFCFSGTVVSIAFFNFAGISVTKEINATTRMVLDSVRVLAIWGVSLAVGWQDFILLQVRHFRFIII